MNDESKSATILGPKEIAAILPHRYPFLFIDRVIELDLEAGSIVGIKCFTVNEEFFQGHFPNYPIVPGVLILEALAQVGGILAYKKGYQDKIAVLLTIDEAKFRSSVHPGESVTLYAHGLQFSHRGGRIKAEAKVEGRRVAEAKIGFALRGLEQV